MRTPGHDVELALGFLLTQSFIFSMADVHAWKKSATRKDGQLTHAITITLTPQGEERPATRETMVTTTSGGRSQQTTKHLHGNSSTDSTGHFEINKERLFRLPGLLRLEQGLFQATGGAHAAAVFDVHGNLEIVREDVGRHNAVDKICGYLLIKDGIPANQYGLLLSGRVSFDLILKAIACGIEFIVAIGVPTHQAVVLARRHSVSLVGFLKPNQMNIYSGTQRVKGDGA